MANLDDIAEVMEELGIEPGAEIIFRYDGLALDISAITTHGAEPGTVHFVLDED